MKTLILAGLMAFTLSAKDRNWQMGKVEDVQISSNYAGQTPQGYPINVVVQTVGIIGSDGYDYVARRGLNCVWGPLGCPKAAELIANTPVKFAVEKRKKQATALGGMLFLIDANGKEYQYLITAERKDQ